MYSMHCKIDRHLLSKHPGPEQKANPMFCTEDECTFVTVVDTDMKRHMKEKHEGMIKYKCNIMNCNYGTESKKAFHYHTKSHSKIDTGKDRNFAKSSENNMRKHSNEVDPKSEIIGHPQLPNQSTYGKLQECDKCGYKTTQNRNFLVHMKSKDHSDLMQNFSQCDFIPAASVTSVTTRRRGAEDCELPDKSKFLDGDLQKCDKCEYKSAKFYNMRVHIRKVHFDLKHKCAQCDFSHLFPSMVKKHFRIKHLKIGRQKKTTTKNMLERKLQRCTNCNSKIKYVSNLRKHKMKQCVEKPHHCTQCNFASIKSINLKRHIQSKHLKIRPKKKQTTQKMHEKAPTSPLPIVRALLEEVLKAIVSLGQTNAVTLKSQPLIQSKKKLHICTECNYSTKYVSILRRHEMKHVVKKPYNCNQCNYSSIKSINLNSHRRIHHGEKRYNCRMCDFSSNTNMKEHMMKNHPGEKPLKCYQCNYTCVTSGHLKSHMRKHTGERPFKCSKCDKAFKHNNILKRHHRIHLTSNWGIFGGVFMEGASISQ